MKPAAFDDLDPRTLDEAIAFSTVTATRRSSWPATERSSPRKLETFVAEILRANRPRRRGGTGRRRSRRCRMSRTLHTPPAEARSRPQCGGTLTELKGQIFDAYVARGLGVRAIAQDLNARSVRPATSLRRAGTARWAVVKSFLHSIRVENATGRESCAGIACLRIGLLSWWRWEELNLRHGAYETPALPLSYTAESEAPSDFQHGILPQGKPSCPESRP
jgi:hypothetical protein